MKSNNKSNYKKVIEFHKKFDIPVNSIGHIPTSDRILLRIRLIAEELGELIEAMERKDYPQVAKEMADLLYTVYGTGVEWGVPVDEIFQAVHAANMTKEGAQGTDAKIRKGKNYSPPDIEHILQQIINRRQK